MIHERLQQANRWLQCSEQPMPDQVLRWAAQNSWSMNPAGLMAMAAILQSDFACLDLPCDAIALPSIKSVDDEGRLTSTDTGPLLQWSYRPSAARQVVLVIHYDTVYPPPAYPPTSVESPHRLPRRDEGYLRGPGVADAKGGIAVILYAMRAILQFDLLSDIGVTIQLNPDEEIGSPCSAGVFERSANRFQAGFLFEPKLPDGAMVANRKGTGNFTFLVHGRSAHAGRNLTQGRNAIVQASRLAIELDRWNDPEALGPRIAGPHELSVNVGRIFGGGPLNQVPDYAMVAANIRVSRHEAMQIVEERLQMLVQSVSSQEGYRCELLGGFHSPPKSVADNEEFAKLKTMYEAVCQDLSIETTWKDTGGACDGNKWMNWGVPNIDTLGPIGGNLHSQDEYCDAASLISSAQTLVHLLVHWERAS